MSMLDPRTVASALGGVAKGNRITAPGPGHSSSDKSLSILIDPGAPDGFVVNSFANDDPLDCKDYIRSKLGMRRERKPKDHPIARLQPDSLPSEKKAEPLGKI